MTLSISRKNVIIIASAAVIALSMAIGSTLAWLTVSAGAKNNEFSVITASGDNPDMKASLTEPNWDSTGKAKASRVVPGQSIPKDPTITNTSVLPVSEWAAIRVTFTNGAGSPLAAADYQKLTGIISVNYGSGWYQTGPTSESPSVLYFYYKTPLEQNESTSPLFTAVSVNQSAGNDDMAFIKDTLKGFDIQVSGAVVQGDAAKTPAWTSGDAVTNNLIAAFGGLFTSPAA